MSAQFGDQVARLGHDARVAATGSQVDEIALAMLLGAHSVMRDGMSLVFLMAAVVRVAEHVLATGVGDAERAESRANFLAHAAAMTMPPCSPLVEVPRR